MEIFGERLKETRTTRGLKLDDVVKLYNKRFGGKLNKGTLSKYENNKQIPMVTVARDLSEVLEVSTDYLLGKTDVFESDNFPRGENTFKQNKSFVDSSNLLSIIDNLNGEKRAIIEDVILSVWRRQKQEKNV